VRLDVGASGDDEVGFQALVRSLEQAFAGKDELNMLLLSGGGSRGAWGAGVLNGWSQNPKGNVGRCPLFNGVTGVSTGAVQATSVACP